MPIEAAAEGLTDRQIAQRLSISVGAVDAHWRHLRERYDLPSRASVVARCLCDRYAEERRALVTDLQEFGRRERELQKEVESLRHRAMEMEPTPDDALWNDLEPCAVPPRLPLSKA